MFILFQQPQPSWSLVTAMPKEQEAVADPNVEEDIFAKFEDSPSPAANQVHVVSCMYILDCRITRIF